MGEPELPIEDVQRFAPALVRAAAMMARLRDRDGGCPWDQAQTFETIAPYTIEEAYEVADAIARMDHGELKGELGDLLFQVLFHARMAEEAGLFDLSAVADGLTNKMVRRHPHVFEATGVRSADDQVHAWEAQKAEERAQANPNASVIDGVAQALPALARAEKLTRRAARIGFDWPDADAVLIKLEEELGELSAARLKGAQEEVAEELGDVLFVIANLARKLEVDPEAALRSANVKFERRFRVVEAKAKAAGAGDLETLERFWQEAKRAERAGQIQSD
jgi:MazG family protein